MAEEVNANKITADVISDLAKSAAKFIVQKLVNKYNDMVKKNNIDYGAAFEKYLLEAQKHIGMAKTILYGQTPHDLYSFFECMGVCNRKTEIDTSNVNNILDVGHKIIITGTGGIGKSMLMRHCFLDTIKNTSYIPILVELRGLNEFNAESISIEKYIYRILDIFGFRLEEEYFKYSLETGCYVILFDGYDEVKNAISQKVSREIIDFSNRYSDNHIIVSSRPLDEFVGWSDFAEFSSMALTKEQALSLISKLDYDEDLKKKFYKQLDNELYDKYESFASNPLLLTIMLMTFEDRISIPDSKTDFYEQAFSTLFHRHDAMKKGKFKREILSNLGYEDFKKIFSYFCFRTFFKNQYEFTEQSALENIAKSKEKIFLIENFEDTDYLNDMTRAVCMLVHDGLNYRFSHRSFQEYFAAVYTTQLSDDEQKQFILSWLKSIDGRLTTDFLDILCTLQPDRFMKNILYDEISELHKMYKNNSCSDDWFINYMYSAIIVSRDEDTPYRVAVIRNNQYHCTIFNCALHYLHYPYDFEPDEEYHQIVKELIGRYQYHPITFQKLKDDKMYEKVKRTIKWIIQRKNSVFNEFEKIDINTFGRKRKFESMLDNL